MYPECRHVLASGDTCNSPALAKSAWCYFHTRMHHRQGQRQAARHTHRRPDGRFAALPAPSEKHIETIDYGAYFKKLQEFGYRGDVVVEVSAMLFKQPEYDPKEAARKSYAALTAGLEKAGLTRQR